MSAGISGCLLPPALRPGDLLGVCAPSSRVRRDDLLAGVAALEALGFRVRFSQGVLERELFSAGSLARRVDELHELFGDPEVKGVVCARGGAGAGGLLAHLDEGRLLERPKVFLGSSDVTALHRFLNRAGLVTFHGPMVAGDLASGNFDQQSLLASVGGGPPFVSPAGALQVLRSGTGEGRLLGGCLSLVASLAGTPWAFEAGAGPSLLFLEDVCEPPYRVDRMLRQLRDSGVLESVAGVVFGEMKDCDPGETAGYTLADVILRALEGLDIPVASGLSSGHTRRPHLTVPLGVPARLSCGPQARLEVLAPAVRVGEP